MQRKFPHCRHTILSVPAKPYSTHKYLKSLGKAGRSSNPIGVSALWIHERWTLVPPASTGQERSLGPAPVWRRVREQIRRQFVPTLSFHGRLSLMGRAGSERNEGCRSR